MPPKTKKQLEQQAKRLEQQQRLKQQEQARLQIQRKKYSQQKMQSGLILPVSDQLIIDFSGKQSAFIEEKLKQVLNNIYPSINQEAILKKIIKQICHYIKNLRNIFLFEQKTQEEQRKKVFLKIRVLIGILLKVYLNEHTLIQGKGKNKVADEILFKNLLSQHSQKKTQLKIFQKNDILVALEFAKQNYFNHFKIIHNFNKFKKRQEQIQTIIYVSSPTIQFNNKNTDFTDLNKREQHLNSNGQLKQSQ